VGSIEIRRKANHHFLRHDLGTGLEPLLDLNLILIRLIIVLLIDEDMTVVFTEQTSSGSASCFLRLAGAAFLSLPCWKRACSWERILDQRRQRNRSSHLRVRELALVSAVFLR
jgi:hypothetical protein